LCGQPIKRAADAQKLERRLQVFVRLQTSIRALLILASQSPFSFAEPNLLVSNRGVFS
jgi:gamma-glutamylcysteine synthetase